MSIKIERNIVYIVLAYICAFFIIYMSGSVNQSVRSVSSVWDIVQKYISLAISLLFTCISISYIEFAANLFTLSICVFLLGILFIANYPATMISLAFLLVRFIAFIGLFEGMKRKNINFMRVMYKTFIYIAIATLVCYLVINVIGINIPCEIVDRSKVPWHTDNYYIYFGGLYQYRPVASYLLGNYSIVRLSGFAWEPGVYGIFISFAIFYYMFIYNEKKKFELIILMISALLTFSTACLGVVTILAFKYFFYQKINTYNKYIMVIIILPFVIAFIFSIFSEKFSNSSGQVRIDDFLVGLKIFISNPILGIGYNNTDIFMDLQGLSRGNSNGLMSWIYYMGVIGTTALISPFLFNLKHENKKKKLLYLFVFVCCNITEPVIEFPFMTLLISYEYYKMGKKVTRVKV